MRFCVPLHGRVYSMQSNVRPFFSFSSPSSIPVQQLQSKSTHFKPEMKTIQLVVLCTLSAFSWAQSLVPKLPSSISGCGVSSDARAFLNIILIEYSEAASVTCIFKPGTLVVQLRQRLVFAKRENSGMVLVRAVLKLAVRQFQPL